MISQRVSGLNTVLFISQLVLSLSLFWVGVLLISTVYHTNQIRWDSYSVYAAVIFIGLLLEMLTNKRLELGTLHRGFLDAHRLAARQLFFSGGLLLLYLVANKDAVISRLFIAFYLPSLYLLLFVTSRFFPRIVGRSLYPEARWEKILLVGSPNTLEKLRPWLARKADVGFRAIGFLDHVVPNPSEPCSFPRLGSTHEMVEVVQKHAVTQVIRTEMFTTYEDQRAFIETCDLLNVRLLVVANLPERWGRPLTFVDDDGVRFIALREEALENPFNQVTKRALDLMIAVPVVLFVLPFTTLLVRICQAWQSPGPIFFRQNRAGLQNQEFKIVKYRTMHLGHRSEAKQATRADERIYPAGRWLRKLSIDELPQFWNVLSGEMSIVGPRPHLIEHNSLFARQLTNYHVRTFVKPGITGLAQVNGLRGEARSMDDIARRIAADIEYLENWRMALEVSIILKTILHVIRPPKSAY